MESDMAVRERERVTKSEIVEKDQKKKRSLRMSEREEREWRTMIG